MAHIVLVDDDAAVLQTIADALIAGGHSVATAGTLGEALAALGRQPADLIISDSVFVGNGDTMAGIARQRGLPIILISGHPDRIRRQSGGPLPFLAKPFAIAHLLQLVVGVLGGRQP